MPRPVVMVQCSCTHAGCVTSRNSAGGRHKAAILLQHEVSASDPLLSGHERQVLVPIAENRFRIAGLIFLKQCLILSLSV